MKKDNNPHYISNKEFILELKRFRTIGKISKRLHEMFYILAERIIRKSLFYRRLKEQAVKSNDFQDNVYEAIHEGYLKCILRIESFKIDTYLNPFSYFTSVIINCFKDYFHREYRQEVLKMISQNNYDHKFLIKYGFPSNHIFEED